MTPDYTSSAPAVAIACGGTGGHLFPGLAVADHLLQRGCAVMLFVSTKEVDRQATEQTRGMDVEIATLPAIGLSRGRAIAFARGFLRSYRAARKICATRRFRAALAMGGFTSAPPILAARKFGAQTFLHESNTIPGRANRWLSWVVDGAFTGFPRTAARLHNRRVANTGTPVRPQFRPLDPAACRTALGLDPARPVLLVMGGSQGASGLNALVTNSLPLLNRAAPQLQLLHLTGPTDAESVRSACAALELKAVVHPFFAEMELALGAATLAVSRAGASSLAELAALRVPAVLIPYPAATDNHQFHNAQAYVETGAARLLEQRGATPETLSSLILELLGNAAARERMQASLAHWHTPDAAEEITQTILGAIASNAGNRVRASGRRTRRPKPTRPMNTTLEIPIQRESELAAALAERVSSDTAIHAREPLARRTTLRVGGPADLYIEPATEDDLAAALRFCAERGLQFFILGRGSNLLVRDGGYRGAVISLAHPQFSRIEVVGERLHCGAGARLKAVATEAKRNRLAGLEFFEGIPGSVGGALRMNAGAMGGSTFDVVESVRLMDFGGEVRELTPAEMTVEYRSSPTLIAHVALGAVLRGRPDSLESITQRMIVFSRKRWSSQPAAPSAGCIFKNPTAIPAGRLIDELGLKGTRVGGAVVSAEHGNFIVNDGGATAQDVLELIEILKACALSERGIELYTEVEIVGEDA